MMFKTTMASVLALGMAASAATSTQLSSQVQTKLQTKQIKNQSAAISNQMKSQSSSASSTQSKMSVGQDGNGGGGVVKNGVYTTFYSAGLYVEPSGPSGSAQLQIPGLNEVISYISKFPVSRASKSTVLAALVPTDERYYYVASPDALTPDVKKRLLSEFQRVTNVNADSLTLFALTDTHSKTTFLLPEYFKLSLADQEAILFHEAYWLIHPDAKYDDVVKAEMAFEAALQAPNDLGRISDFVNQIGTYDEAYEAKIKWELSADLQSGALNGLIKRNNRGYYIPLQALVGEDTVNCQNTDDGVLGSTKAALGVSLTCEPYLSMNINQLLGRYPKSLLLQAWKTTISRNDITDYFSSYARKIGVEVVSAKYGGSESWAPADIHSCKVYIASGDDNVECAYIYGVESTKKVTFLEAQLLNIGYIRF